MSMSFPESPELNQEHSFGERTWVFNGVGWVLKLKPESQTVRKANVDLSNVSQADIRSRAGTGTMAYRNFTFGVEDPVGGLDGDIHVKFV